MRLDKLQLDLRPRPNAQALDLGFTVLRAHAANTYLAWLALWLPTVGLCTVLACFFRSYANLLLVLAWWVRPMLERAPLYVLSRQVFGEEVSWRDALRAWPGQCKGGWFFLLTWGRLFAVGRGLYQPIWQLEGARGKVAAERRKILGKNGTARAASWFGAACANLEGVLQLGLLSFIGIFVSDEQSINPFALLVQIGKAKESLHAILLTFGVYAVAGAIIGPIFVACGFTLYLNRRATLEAWDIEIALRQIKPPQSRPTPTLTARAASQLGMLFCAALLATALLPPMPVQAATTAVAQCAVPPFVTQRDATRTPDQSAAQTEIRREVAQLYETDDLRGYSCSEQWAYKFAKADKPVAPKSPVNVPNLGLLADVIKLIFIAAVVFLVGWLLYRYRDQLAALARLAPAQRATEIAGMDIRPESLPEDVPARVAQLWTQGQRRAALALLYRATISRLVNDDHLHLTQGATEGDCLRAAQQAHRQQQLAGGRAQTTHVVTDLWLKAAYGDRWPDDAAVAAGCASWRAAFAIAAPSSKVPQ
jgi:hypothetical protein